ncbi:alpha-L-rhamnosidase [Arachidicoccus ginsenosidimutans]|uniref:alpha-L-rhamnosidase-related protein n=1 Tax=Arachidicoccus sp. BS20 TaxID=1850526 RepID=UPI0007F0D641|nr:alpha-L-rhamnosidase C-terminal domain-containing protein [Arachidicoccus sp. BS20]ANI89632.1 alpha-L-rhamnosidase [Arachidicoccus sp. BS20]
MIFSHKIFGSFLSLLFALITAVDANAQSAAIPTDLRVDLLQNTDKVWKNGFEVKESLEQASKMNDCQTARITSSEPWFSWMMNSDKQGACQTAYQVLVASSARKLKHGIGNVWNSGKIISNLQSGIPYNGKKLLPNTVYYWKVKIWDNTGSSSEFSKTSSFLTDSILKPYQTPYTPIVKSVQQPFLRKRLNSGNELYDFGKDAFGQLRLLVKAKDEQDTLRIYVGEAVDQSGSVDRKPKGEIRYRQLILPLKKGKHYYFPAFAPNKLNTGPRAIHMPEYIGEVMPFRYVETENNANVKIIKSQRYAVNYIFNDTATEFESSDTILNKVWDLCKYTMKATSFTGLYIDGDRERTPYEADALINQLSYYASDAEYNIAKRSMEYLVYHATWPTEWSLQNLLIAWNDYMYSGDIRAVENIYEELKPKTLLALARSDGLISTRTGKQDSSFARSLHLINFDGKTAIRDIVDWPQKGGVGLAPSAQGETDGFVFTDYNSVVNAFHYRALVCMQNLAAAIGKKGDAEFYKKEAEKVKRAFQHSFIDSVAGTIKDGEGTMHSSLHANMMALAFGLVPDKNKSKVLSFIQSRGMACSVYGAQFLLDALYSADDPDYALKLLTSMEKRSWYNMIRTGATMTTEAWDMEFKGNEDWGHAWGSAPANIIVRKLMGVTPLTPAFGTVQIKPQPGTLNRATLKVATLRGRVEVSFSQNVKSFHLETRLPANTHGIVYLPRHRTSDELLRNGKRIVAIPAGNFWLIKNVTPGRNIWQVNYR